MAHDSGMEKRDRPTPDETVRTAPGAAPQRHKAAPADRAAGAGEQRCPAFEWQAVLLRYLPDPRGPHHSMKRFAAR
jgi:hypothetical protein